MGLKDRHMNIVCNLTSRIRQHAGVAANVLLAAAMFTPGGVTAQDGTVGRRAASPVIEWSIRPPMGADLRGDESPRDVRLRDTDAPVLTDPVAPTERLRQLRMNDALNLRFAIPQDLLADRSRIVVSLRATPASRATMVVEQATSARTSSSWLDVQAADTPTTRIGLELRSASAEKRLGFNNVLKMQLSGGSTLLLKPRRSGVAVTWRSEF